MRISELASTDSLVMDTHVWVWSSGEAGGPTLLNTALLHAIEAAARSRRLFVSAASVWEIALKVERGHVLVSGELSSWVSGQRRYPGVRVLPIDARLGNACTQLPAWIRKRDAREHRDPSDRFIAATARRLNGVLLTCDEEMLAYAEGGHLRACDAC